MKHYLQNSLRALFLSLSVLLSLPMLAEEIGGINYDLNADTKEAAVIAKSSGRYSGEIVIPESVEHEGATYSVTGIGEKAFENCSGLTSVTIPNSVTSIGGYAFKYCYGLTSVTIGNGVTSIGESAFEGCSGLTSVHISDLAAWCKIEFKSGGSSNPLYHEGHLYLNGKEVKDLIIPNSVTSIGNYAFSGCSGLTSVTIGNSVTSIGGRAFEGCSGLTSVTIPNSVTSIGNYAFSGCSGLTSVTIGNGVTSIGGNAFYRCSGLTSVHISDLVAWCDIESNAYFECAYRLYLNGEEVKNLVIPNSVTSIRKYAFRYCASLTSVTIHEGVTEISSSAFKGCHITKENFRNYSSLDADYNQHWGATLYDYETEDGLLINGATVGFCRKSADRVTIPNSVTSIRNSAFSGCSGLTSVTIPNSVTSIGNYAFSGCSGLTSITIGNSVTSIGESAFEGCSGLTSVTIPNSVTSIGGSAFKDTRLQTIICKPIKIPEIWLPDYVCSMYNHTQVYVPEGTYWDYAFSDWGYFIHIKEMAMDAEDLEKSKAYMIADASGRNYTVYNAEKDKLVNVAYTHALDEESEGSCWSVLKEGNASHLYNIGAKKYGYVKEDGTLDLSETPVCVDIANTEGGLSINGNACMFVLNSKIGSVADGIEELKAGNGTKASVLFDLNGRRVQKAQKGLYIQNGRKVLIK